MSDNFDFTTVHLHYHIENLSIKDTFIVPNLCKDRLLYFYIQILRNKKKIKEKYFRYNKQNKTLLSGQYCDL